MIPVDKKDIPEIPRDDFPEPRLDGMTSFPKVWQGHLSNEKGPLVGCDIGDDELPNYIGIIS